MYSELVTVDVTLTNVYSTTFFLKMMNCNMRKLMFENLVYYLSKSSGLFSVIIYNYYLLSYIMIYNIKTQSETLHHRSYIVIRDFKGAIQLKTFYI